MKIYFFRNLFVLLLLPVIALAQDDAKENKIKLLADEACNCAREISVNLPKDTIISKINTCISSKILMDQMKNVFAGIEEVTENDEKETDTIEVTSEKKEKNIVIYADENFEEIQAYMRGNCESVKFLMGSHNDESAYSMSKNKKALKFYEEGQDYDNRQQFDMAIVSYKKAVEADPKFAFAWDNMGFAFRKLGKYEDAIKCYKKSLAIDPKGKMPLMNTGVAYMLMEDYKAASKTYADFIKRHPDDPEGYFGAGKCFYIIEDYAKGVDYMFKAYKMYAEAKSPYFSDAQKIIGMYYNDLEEKGKLNIFMKAAKNNNIEINE